jgi:YfiH family protein
MIEIIRPQWPAPAAVSACCTTRRGGVSESPFDSFNLALHVGDDEIRVRQNRQNLRDQMRLPAEPGWINQTHGTRTVILEQDACRDADAAITREPGQVAVVMTADCLPILICNHAGTEVAAVHAGWRGLQAGVIQSALVAMQSANDDLMAWIGPGISRACFEVGDEVRSAFIDSIQGSADYFASHGPGHWLCDLAGLAAQVLNRQGVSQVFRDPHCSYRDAELFYSYRRTATTGRMAALIWIN